MSKLTKYIINSRNVNMVEDNPKYCESERYFEDETNMMMKETIQNLQSVKRLGNDKSDPTLNQQVKKSEHSYNQ